MRKHYLDNKHPGGWWRALMWRRYAEALEELIEEAATEKLSSSKACPLCTYDNGVFIKSCQMHEEMFQIMEERERYLTALRKIDEGSFNFGNRTPGLTVWGYVRRVLEGEEP